MIEPKELQKVTNPYGAFKKNALGVDSSASDEVKQHYLRGSWRDGTLKSYNSGVVKLYRFAKLKKIDKRNLLPISPQLVKQFVVWASKKDVERAYEDESVKASTLKVYLAGIKAWHMFHNEKYPHQVDEAVRTLLRATKMTEARMNEVESKRPPMLVSDLVILLEVLPTQGEKSLAILTVALVAFWGTARLGELISDNAKKKLPSWDDVEWAEDKSYVKIRIMNAKTAKPGEIQWIHLQQQASVLDPVSILEEWFAYKPRKMSDEIFSIHVDDRRRRLGKQSTINHLRAVWNDRRPKGKRLLHGHSFRIGGASLRWNLGLDREEVKRCGRWASDAYLVYLRKFLDRELAKTQELLRELRWEPETADGRQRGTNKLKMKQHPTDAAKAKLRVCHS